MPPGERRRDHERRRPSRSSSGSTRSRCWVSARKLQHDVPGERVDPLEPLGRVLGADRAHGVVLVRLAGHRAAEQPELGGVVVGDEQQRSEPSGSTTCSAWYSTPVPPAADRARRRLGACGVDHPDLAVSRLSAQITTTPPLRVARTSSSNARPAPRAPARRRPRACRAGAARPGRAGRPRRGRCRRSGPSPRSRRRRSSVRGTSSGRSCAGLEVAEPQRVDLVTGRVDRVRQQALVRADQASAPSSTYAESPRPAIGSSVERSHLDCGFRRCADSVNPATIAW